MASEYDSYSHDFEDDTYKDEDFEEYYSDELEDVAGDLPVETRVVNTASEAEEGEELLEEEIETETEPDASTTTATEAEVRREIDAIGEKSLPARTAKILVERIRASKTCSPSFSQEMRQQDASLTYSALLPNIESWAVESQLVRAREHPLHRRRSRKVRSTGRHAVPSHVVDRLKIESLTLSMENYNAEQTRYKPRANVGVGLSRMVQVVTRKHRVPLSSERTREIYEPAAILSNLAESHRQMLERFDVPNENAIQV
jgi:hypothetical protein